MIRSFVLDDELRHTLGELPSGVVAVAAETAEGTEVLVATSFTAGVSHDPPLALFAVQHTSRTWLRLAAAPVMGVSVLGHSNHDIVRQLASRDRLRRLDGVPVWRARSGAVFIEGAPAWLECAPEQRHAAGDHDIVVLRVLAAMHDPTTDPLIRHRREYRALAV